MFAELKKDENENQNGNYSNWKLFEKRKYKQIRYKIELDFLWATHKSAAAKFSTFSIHNLNWIESQSEAAISFTHKESKEGLAADQWIFNMCLILLLVLAHCMG